MGDWITGFLGLALGFSGLIFIHELGHFLLAKWHGVRVHVFSIGMGPYILTFTIGETVYALSLVPIGGYVKLAGQDDMRPNLEATKDPRDYRNKPVGARAAILAAGAVFNLIFALLAFTFCYWHGVELNPPKVGEVFNYLPIKNEAKIVTPTGAQPHPLQKGDLIVAVNGRPVKSFLDVALAVAGSGSDEYIWLDYERRGERQHDPVRVKAAYDNDHGAKVIGLAPYYETQNFRMGFKFERNVQVGKEPEKDSVAAAIGLQKGDVLVSIDGERVEENYTLMHSVDEKQGKKQKLVIERDGKEKELDFVAEGKDRYHGTQFLLGVQLLQADRINEIDQRSEAYAEGMREGDYIRAFTVLRDKKNVYLEYTRTLDENSEMLTAVLPRETSILRESCPWEVGYPIEGQVLVKAGSFVEALGMAWDDLLRYSGSVFTVVRGLLTGQVSPKALSGPVGIANAMTSVASQKPFMYYFWFLAFISINLGVLQFIPIPLLDGWHLLMLAVEKLKGSPVAPRIQEAFQWVGLFLILSLLVWATSNDIMRFLKF